MSYCPTQMEELREAALGYYENASSSAKERACTFFNWLDTNHDGKVSQAEFKAFILQQGHAWNEPNELLFAQLDQNGDGGLDFLEVITLYYKIVTRNVFCRSCGTNLLGLYFTCTRCFDHDTDIFDICLSCYRSVKFVDHHADKSLFVDSYVLLRSRRRKLSSTIENHQPNNVQAPVHNQAQPLILYQTQPYGWPNNAQALDHYQAQCHGWPNNAQAHVHYQAQPYGWPNNAQAHVHYHAQPHGWPHNAQAPVHYQAQPLIPYQAQPQRRKWVDIVHAVQGMAAVIGIGTWAGGLCSIM